MNTNKKKIDTYVTKTEYDAETGFPIKQMTRLHGKLQSPPDGSPSVIRFVGGRPATFEWHDQNLDHRVDGPASVRVDPVSGKTLLEVFQIQGQPRSPEDGAFRIWYDSEGNVERKIFAEDEDYVPVETIELQRNKLEPN